MTPDTDDLATALAPIAALVRSVGPDTVDGPTPCRDWTVADLTSHLLADLDNFTTMARGGDPDWSNRPALPSDPAAAVDAATESVLQAWRHAEQEDAAPPVALALAEFVTHGWDLAQALGRDYVVSDEVVGRGLEFMIANLTPDQRAGAFAPPLDIVDDAPVLDRLIGFAGRDPGWTRS